MMFNRLAFVGFWLVLAVPCFSVQAQTAPPPAGKPPAAQGPIQRSEFIQAMDAEFKERDADKNGIVTKKEIEAFQRAFFARVNQARLAALFQRLDADKNGQLSPSEFASLNGPAAPVDAGLLLKQVDLNHDGQVTIVEYRSGKLRSFDDMDADKDGIVSVSEMKAGGLIKQ
jgi:Ca2+-binding EF-hand superfamily protein